MHIGYPFRIDGGGRTAVESEQDHIRDLIEQVLLTMPGERVNRPDFGSGLTQFVFGAPNDEMVAATRVLIQGSLQQWLGDLIEVEGVEVALSTAPGSERSARRFSLEGPVADACQTRGGAGAEVGAADRCRTALPSPVHQT